MRLYHVTPTRNLGRILRKGLLPRRGPRSRDAKERIPAIATRNRLFGDKIGMVGDVLNFDPTSAAADLVWQCRAWRQTVNDS